MSFARMKSALRDTRSFVILGFFLAALLVGCSGLGPVSGLNFSRSFPAEELPRTGPSSSRILSRSYDFPCVGSDGALYGYSGYRIVDGLTERITIGRARMESGEDDFAYIDDEGTSILGLYVLEDPASDAQILACVTQIPGSVRVRRYSLPDGSLQGTISMDKSTPVANIFLSSPSITRMTGGDNPLAAFVARADGGFYVLYQTSLPDALMRIAQFSSDWSLVRETELVVDASVPTQYTFGYPCASASGGLLLPFHYYRNFDDEEAELVRGDGILAISEDLSTFAPTFDPRSTESSFPRFDEPRFVVENGDGSRRFLSNDNNIYAASGKAPWALVAFDGNWKAIAAACDSIWTSSDRPDRAYRAGDELLVLNGQRLSVFAY